MPSDPLCLSIVDLTVEYKQAGIRPVTALNAVTIPRLTAGELVLLSGPNGAGKSTLLRALTGSLKASTGHLMIHSEGEKVSESVVLSDRYRVAFISQRPTDGLVAQFTVAESLLSRELAWKGLSVSLRPWPTRSDKERVRDALASVLTDDDPMVGLLDRPTSTLSGGQQQIVNVLSSALGSADVLLMDEPTSLLDEHYGPRVWDLAKRISRKGVLVLIATHEQLKQGWADREIRLVAGSVVSDSSNQEEAEQP